MRHVVLIGLMASGKTTVGRRLADRLGRPFVDNDRALTARTGRSAREIAAASDAPTLHRLEAEALVAALAAPEHAVVAAAAGAIGEPGVAAALAGHDVVYLRAAPEVLAARVARGGPGGAHRPFVDHDAGAVLAEQFAARDATYRAVATLVVDAGGDDPDAVVDAVAAALAR